ncbi:MAG: aspartate--tRNA ligase [Deltaproteobacteria bacterium]|nr:aspartate--tRNA ligase [Deltaproteobacteria bacterium]
MNIDTLNDWKRSHDCGGLRAEDEGKEALLMGWVNSRRDLGNLIFIDLRDRDGITQIVFDPQKESKCHEKAHILRNEWVIAVKGKVVRRLNGQENKNMATGDIELIATELKILNKTEVPPFQIDGAVDASETLRLKYRYLELRRPKIFQNFKRRHLMAVSIRDYLNERGFLEVETPILTKSTPEGARDYLVPSRVNKGTFFALPQSPQLFKQLLMVAGFEKYYQIVRCFRDEDLRADRQPEFTQVDLEMSFVNEDDVMDIFEGMVRRLFKEILDVDIVNPVPRIEYIEAMDRYGSDKPDTRFGLELKNISDIVSGCEFKVFKETVGNGGIVKGINVKGAANNFSRKIIDELAAYAAEFGAKGLAWIKITDGPWQSPIAKFLNENEQKSIEKVFDAAPNDLILLVADKQKIVNQALGALRLNIAARLELVAKDNYSFLWVTKFPLMEYNEEEGRFQAMHHPFTSPLIEDMPMLDSNTGKVRARAYDLILNGVEIGGGSIRIHDTMMQERIFNLLGISKEEADIKFGFLLEALKYGAPPHGGMAIGFDRLAAIMSGADSIREVIAFPKTSSASCLMTNAPSSVDEAQLKELGLSIR